MSDKQALIDLLRDTQQNVVSAIDGVTEQDCRTKPAADRWSVLDCMEHIALVEQLIVQRVQQAPLSETSMRDSKLEERIRAAVPDRSGKAQAPEIIHPKGRHGSLAEAQNAFLAARN